MGTFQPEDLLVRFTMPSSSSSWVMRDAMEKMLIMSEYIHYLYDVYNSYEHMNEYNNSSKMKSKRMESTKAYNNARSSSRVKDVFYTRLSISECYVSPLRRNHVWVCLNIQCKVTKNRETSSWNFYKRLLFKIDFTPGILPLRPCALLWKKIVYADGVHEYLYFSYNCYF